MNARTNLHPGLLTQALALQEPPTPKQIEQIITRTRNTPGHEQFDLIIELLTHNTVALDRIETRLEKLEQACD